MRKALRYDYNFMLSPFIQEGVSDKDLIETHEQIKQVTQSKETFTFRKLILQPNKATAQIASEIRKNFNHLVIVGIGGSDLGSRAIVESLNSLADNKVTVSFIGNTTDPDEITALLGQMDLDKTLFSVISKSGETIEILANFLHIREILKARYQEKYIYHLIAITNPQSGTLRDICLQEKIPLLYGPQDVGDRFSVLSIIGMLTAGVMGLDIEQFWEGAKYVDSETESLNTNEPLNFALMQYILCTKYHKSISVLMPYARHLQQFAFWYRQLWAESLGKAVNKEGNTVHTGITPIASLGSTDQHSQIQLYNEGPNDKMITFIELEKFSNDITLSVDGLEAIHSVQLLQGKTLGQLTHIEREATALSLKENGRPNGTIYIDSLDEYALGSLFYFFELAVGYLGELLNIDTFNQPGVEKGKQYIIQLLSS